MRKETTWETFKWYAGGTAIVVINNIVRTNYRIYKTLVGENNNEVKIEKTRKNKPKKKTIQASTEKTQSSSVDESQVEPISISGFTEDVNDIEEQESLQLMDEADINDIPLDQYFSNPSLNNDEEDEFWQEQEYDEDLEDDF